MKAYKLIISGKVQGVYFRASAREKAIQNKIIGWIENTPEGKVLATICGEEENCQRFISWCKNGPPLANVQSVNIEAIDLFEGKDFVIIRH